MKKIFLVLVAVIALSCDAPNQSREQGPGSELEEKAPVDPAESRDDEQTNANSDTIQSADQNDQQKRDTL